MLVLDESTTGIDQIATRDYAHRNQAVSGLFFDLMFVLFIQSVS